jgi:hypothetical protein
MNGSGNSGDLILGEGSGLSTFNSALSQTETTVTVNWSGGGQIKPDNEDWTLDTLVKAASSFSTRVSTCPQRTWAILTRYDNNRSFVEWAEKNDIVVPDFHRIQQTTSDLLDNFMEYKNNLSRLNAVMSDPAKYKLSSYKNPVGLSVEALIHERKLLKDEMSKIGYIIDSLNKDPTAPVMIEIQNPILWATRLPVPINGPAADSTNKVFSPAEKVAAIASFPFVNDPIAAPNTNPLSNGSAAPSAPSISVQPGLDTAVKDAMKNVAKNTTEVASDLKASPFAPPPPADICAANIVPFLSESEKAWVSSDDNKRAYSALRFDRATGHEGGGPFNDAPELMQPVTPVTWPQRLEFKMISWGGHNILRHVQVAYDQLLLDHGSDGLEADSLTVVLAAGEKVNRIRMGKGTETWGVEGVAFVEIYTTAGQVRSLGHESDGHDVIDYYPYDGTEGLKGWWGCSGDAIDKLAPIWGR